MRNFILLLVFCAFAQVAAKEAPTSSDLFFKGPSDLIWLSQEIEVGKRVSCQLQVHYYGKEPVTSLVKIYLDGVNFISFPADFKKSGKKIGSFQFRVEREGKHHLEFVILVPGEFRDARDANNRLTVSFRVPGSTPEVLPPQPEPSESVQKITDQREIREKAQLTNQLDSAKKALERELVIQKEIAAKDHEEEISAIEEGYEDFEQADRVSYLDQEDFNPQENVFPPPESEKDETYTGKPVIDLFFQNSGAFELSDRDVKAGRPVSWRLLVASSGTGEGEIEVVVADGNKKIVTQRVWVRGGESLELPMRSVFERPGNHRLIAMINTQNNIVDQNLENNIVEKNVLVG